MVASVRGSSHAAHPGHSDPRSPTRERRSYEQTNGTPEDSRESEGRHTSVLLRVMIGIEGAKRPRLVMIGRMAAGPGDGDPHRQCFDSLCGEELITGASPLLPWKGNSSCARHQNKGVSDKALEQ